MDPWNSGAPPPLIGVPEFPPALDMGPSLQVGSGAPPSLELTPEVYDRLTMSGNVDLGQIRVGPGGIREGYGQLGAPALQMHGQLSAKDLDFLSSTGTITLNQDVRVGPKGLRAPGASPAQHMLMQPKLPEVLSLRDLEITQQLGAGASGKVNLAQHRETRKLYALKDIQVSLDRRALNELGTEIQISRTVESDHVVKCHNAFYEEGHMTLVLEYMDGGSVADLLNKVGVIGEFYLADIARQALRGFRDLHTNKPPIIHRDIKPSNLLLNRAGELKISDFGVSRVLEDSNDVGKTFAGTYTYMSPERIEGRQYSFNSDIWAFGLSLLECGIGEYPYQPAMDYFTLLNAVKNREPPTAPSDEFTPEFCDFINCCLQKQPENRWSAEQLLEHPFCKKYESTRLVDLLNTVP